MEYQPIQLVDSFVVGRRGELWKRTVANTDSDYDDYEIVRSPILRTGYHRFNQPIRGLILTDDGAIYDVSRSKYVTADTGYQSIVAMSGPRSELIAALRDGILHTMTYDGIQVVIGRQYPNCRALLYTVDERILVNINNGWTVFSSHQAARPPQGFRITIPPLENITEIADRFLLSGRHLYCMVVAPEPAVLHTELEEDCYMVGLGEYGTEDRVDYYVIMVCGTEQKRIVIQILIEDSQPITVRNALINQRINDYPPIGFMRVDVMGYELRHENDCLVCSDGTIISINENGYASTVEIPPYIFESRMMKSARTRII